MQTTPLWPLVAYAAILIALMIAVLSATWLLGERHIAGAADEPFESGIVGVGDSRLRLSAKFYLVAMFFVVFDVEALFVFAWAIAWQDVGWAGYVELVVFIGVLIAGLAYLWRLGGLDWGTRQALAPPAARRQRATRRMDQPDAMVADQGRA